VLPLLSNQHAFLLHICHIIIYFEEMAAFVIKLLSAPAVARTHVINELSGVDPGTKMMQYNVPIDALWAPVAGLCMAHNDSFYSSFSCIAGPANPYNPRRGLAAANHFIGHVEVCAHFSFSPFIFRPDKIIRWMVSMATHSMSSV
jgi:hypothetical protein